MELAGSAAAVIPDLGASNWPSEKTELETEKDFLDGRQLAE
jgi:hypothetical protein